MSILDLYQQLMMAKALRQFAMSDQKGPDIERFIEDACKYGYSDNITVSQDVTTGLFGKVRRRTIVTINGLPINKRK